MKKVQNVLIYTFPPEKVTPGYPDLEKKISISNK